MADPKIRDYAVHPRIPDLKSLKDLEVEANRTPNAKEVLETPAKTIEKENIDPHASITLPTRPKLKEDNSYFEEKKERPCARRWRSFMDRNSAANPGSSHYDV